MAIHLITGVPGAGKTLNAIKIAKKHQEEGLEKQGMGTRPVYYYGIRGCKIDEWTEIDKAELLAWESLPDGSIIIVDEVQDVWPQRTGKREIPLSISQLNKHRHRGFDFFMTTQYPKMVDVALRRLIGQHDHYDRRFGSKVINKYTWNSCNDDPTDYHSKREAHTSLAPLDKEIFGLYESAEFHTHKRRIPKKIIAAVLFLLLFVPAAFYFGMGLNVVEAGIPATTTDSDFAKRIETAQETGIYIEDDYTPRVEGFPHTAPIYAEITQPVTYPKYNCIVPTARPRACKCYTQQATKMDVPISICLEIVENGIFDHARPDASSNSFPFSATGR